MSNNGFAFSAPIWPLVKFKFSVKMTVTDMKADANEVTIETMDLAHEGLSISK